MQVLIGLLLLCVVWLQCLGVVHRQVHSGWSSSPPVATLALRVLDHGEHWARDAQDTQGSPNSTSCQLFDLACAGAPLSGALSLVVVLFVPPEQTPTAIAFKHAFFLWAYEARGPPTLI